MKLAVQRARTHRREVELVGLAIAGFALILWVIAFRH
jgi:hypothetical protein